MGGRISSSLGQGRVGNIPNRNFFVAQASLQIQSGALSAGDVAVTIYTARAGIKAMIFHHSMSYRYLSADPAVSPRV